MAQFTVTAIAPFLVGLALPFFAYPPYESRAAHHTTAVTEACHCEATDDASQTHGLTQSGPDYDCGASNVDCVSFNKIETGTTAPGKCHVPTACPSDAEECHHRSYSVTVTIANCASTCCSETIVQPDPLPPRTGCYEILRDGTSMGTRCASDANPSIAIELTGPTGHDCAEDDITKIIKVMCGTSIRGEYTAVFRCGACTMPLGD